MKTSKYIFLIFFGMLLILPAINNIFGIWEFESKNENRIFKNRLVISINNLDAFPNDCDNYLNDNFSFRTPLLDFYHKMKFNVFKVSSHPDKVILGNNNWFFMAGKEKQIYEGRLNFSENELDEFKNIWEYRKKYLDSMNIKFYWVIAPFKHYIYSENLPFNIKKATENRVNQLINSLNKEIADQITYPIDELIKNKKKHKLYYQLDNHWNNRSGELISNIIVNKISKDFPNKKIENLADYKWKDTVYQRGFLYDIIGVKELSEPHEEVININSKAIDCQKYNFTPCDNFTDEYEIRYVNKNNKDGLKVLVIRDSFGSHTLPFLKEFFNETVYIFDCWKYELHKPIIETMKPDVVIFLGLETHLDNILN